MARLLIENGYVVTVDPARNVYPGGYVVVDDSRIAAVGASGAAPSGSFDEVVDARGFKTADGRETNLLALVYERVFARVASPLNASLMFAVCTVLFWLGVMWILYRRRVFIKV